MNGVPPELIAAGDQLAAAAAHLLDQLTTTGPLHLDLTRPDDAQQVITLSYALNKSVSETGKSLLLAIAVRRLAAIASGGAA
jgi:hypothetical protein